VIAPDRKACFKLQWRLNNVTGTKAKTEKGQPIMTPLAATATTRAGLSERAKADASDMAYIENELGKKPGLSSQLISKTLQRLKLHKLHSFL